MQCHGSSAAARFDLVLEGGSADAVLLEVNAFPAIAGGTMAAVPRGVYARLVCRAGDPGLLREVHIDSLYRQDGMQKMHAHDPMAA